MFGFFESHFLFFGIKITYYGLLIACAMALGVFIACKNAKWRGLRSDDLIVAACYILPIAIIGARAYYCIFSPESYSFLEFFRIWDGGLAVYGSIIGGAIGLLLYCLIHKKNFFDVADITVPSIILGQAIGRIGCYFSHCCYGIEVTDPGLTWFPLSVFMSDGKWHLATFFYESIWNLLGFIVLMLLIRVFKIRQRGAISASYLIIYGIGRAWIEGLRGDSLYIGAIKVSQLLSIILIVVGLGILIFYFIKQGHHPNLGEGKTIREISLNTDNQIVEIEKKENNTYKVKENKSTKNKQKKKE